MIEHVENTWLTWQRASSAANFDGDLRFNDPPKKLGNYYPQWFKDLKADVRHYLPEGYDQNHTARVCLGLRGVNSVGWTLTTEWNWEPTSVQKIFHPEQLHGTCWAEKNDDGEYVWGIYLRTYPWRAKMAKGHRLLIADYPLEFSTDWHIFSGCVDANYNVFNQQLGGIYHYDEPIDPEYNYYNIETVIAVKKNCHIPKDTVTFTIIPIWDPDYQKPEWRGFPDLKFPE
jgi:hypothetical protein